PLGRPDRPQARGLREARSGLPSPPSRPPPPPRARPRSTARCRSTLAEARGARRAHRAARATAASRRASRGRSVRSPADGGAQLARDPRTLGGNVGLPNTLQLLDGERTPAEGVADRPGGGEEGPEEDRRPAEREVRVLHLVDRRSQ